MILKNKRTCAERNKGEKSKLRQWGHFSSEKRTTSLQTWAPKWNTMESLILKNNKRTCAERNKGGEASSDKWGHSSFEKRTTSLQNSGPNMSQKVVFLCTQQA